MTQREAFIKDFTEKFTKMWRESVATHYGIEPAADGLNSAISILATTIAGAVWDSRERLLEP